MKKLFLISLLAVIFSVPAYSQTDTGAANFLGIAPDARTAAMGSAGAASHYGVFSLFNNPALMGFDRNGGVGYSYAPWGKDHTLHTVGASYGIGERGNLFAGFRYYTSPAYDIVNEQGQVTGSFTPKDWAGELGYSMLFGNNFSAGITARMANSTLSDNAKANAFVFDLGLAYRTDFAIADGAALTATLTAANFGTKMKYTDTGYDLPGKVKLGLGFDMGFAENHAIECVVDAGYRIMPSDMASFEAGIGLEYRLFDMVMIRGGYHIGDSEKGFGNYATFGAGVKYYHVQLDAAYMLADKDSIIGNVFRVSLSFDFGIFK